MFLCSLVFISIRNILVLSVNTILLSRSCGPSICLLLFSSTGASPATSRHGCVSSIQYLQGSETRQSLLRLMDQARCCCCSCYCAEFEHSSLLISVVDSRRIMLQYLGEYRAHAQDEGSSLSNMTLMHINWWYRKTLSFDCRIKMELFYLAGRHLALCMRRKQPANSDHKTMKNS